MHAILKSHDLAAFKYEQDADKIIQVLKTFSRHNLTNPAVIKSYHDLLLYHCAFPKNEKIYLLANEELKRIASVVKGASLKLKDSLHATGIANTELICSFSSTIAGWLCSEFPADVELALSEAPNDLAANIIQAMLPAVEYQKASQADLNLVTRLKRISSINNTTSLLKWLLLLFEENNTAPDLKEEIYQQLKIFIRWKLNNVSFSNTFLRLPVKKIYYHDEPISIVNSLEILGQKISKPIDLSNIQKKSLTDTMRASLALLKRETDPVTYADENELELFDVGRGLNIAIIGMRKEKRLALESYIGFMAFKNGIPISYGGGWLWGKRCKIGINIYSAFRKGESAWLFCQVMRIYYQYFGARTFIVKPYQFGKGNPEGLKSGAFWFYYKLGFVPVDEQIKSVAEAESKKIRASKAYRTPLNVLKQFTSCNIEWNIEKENIPSFDASKISIAITELINSKYAASRSKALAASTKKMRRHFAISYQSPLQKKSFENWSLLAELISDDAKWNDQRRKIFTRLATLKQSGAEREYILLLQQQKWLWLALYKAIN